MASAPCIHVLLIDDDEDDFLLTQDLFDEIEGCPYELSWCSRYEEGRDALFQATYDIYLIDYRLGSKTGLDLLREAKSHGVKKPLLLLTGNEDRQIDQVAIKAGAADYLVKGELSPPLLERAIRHALERQTMSEALRRSEERYAIAAKGANDGLWDWNLDTGKVYFSPRWKAMLGYEHVDLQPKLRTWLEQIHPDDIERVREALDKHLQNITPNFEVDYRMLHRDGSYRWMLGRGLAVRGATGQVYRMAGWQTDSSGRVASYDALTNLPNRKLFLDRLRRSLAMVQRYDVHHFAVLYIDLDHFKVVNDSLGHASGDAMLIEVAQRLERSLRAYDTVARVQQSMISLSSVQQALESQAQRQIDEDVEETDHQGGRDTVARFGGDEFAVLLDGLETIHDATVVAERILCSLKEAFRIEEHEFYCSASIGIAMSRKDYSSPDEILRDADIAMYRAKNDGKSRYAIFDAKMHEQVKSRVVLEREFRLAFREEQLRVFYQPIMVLESGELTGFEALVRWQHPTRGLLAPSAFLDMVEETGLIVEMGDWVFERACTQLHRWHEEVDRTLTMNINISGRQLAKPDWPDVVHSIVARTGVNPSKLRFEITESVLMASPERASAVLEELRTLGIRIQIDDFGTGYSSLSRLHRLPLDALKVDRSFVAGMEKDPSCAGIVEAIVGLAKTLGLDVIAEGIEAEGEIKRLQELECDYAQGYFYAKPMSLEETMVFLHNEVLS